MDIINLVLLVVSLMTDRGQVVLLVVREFCLKSCTNTL
jgi:hypothetical protein